MSNSINSINKSNTASAERARVAAAAGQLLVADMMQVVIERSVKRVKERALLILGVNKLRGLPRSIVVLRLLVLMTIAINIPVLWLLLMPPAISLMQWMVVVLAPYQYLLAGAAIISGSVTALMALWVWKSVLWKLKRRQGGAREP